MYGIEDEFTAWCFDRAVSTFGGALENAIRDASEGAKDNKSARTKAQRVMLKWLSSADTKAAKGMYRDPMAER